MRQVPRKILLGITGSIAAYKIPLLIRQLREQNYEVKVVITTAAKSFVTPLILQCLSNNPVYETLLDPESEMAMEHIELARWADVILIAPATANCIAKLAHGLADDLLSTICLVAQCPIILAPAMNQQMYLNSATQDNLKILKQRGVLIWGPTSGEQACGEVGPGRMLEPEEIVALLVARGPAAAAPFSLREKREPPSRHPSQLQTHSANNLRVLITAGPTQESIDPIRYLSNHSSGKMGYCLAAAFAARGAKIILISGPTKLDVPNNLEKFIIVTTAQDMLDQVLENMDNIDIMISAAAVADYRPAQTSLHKIKKDSASLNLKLIKNPDILQVVRAKYPKVFLVGFALETENLLANAERKLNNKQLDIIIANQVSDDNPVFGVDENTVTVLQKQGEQIVYPKCSKPALAEQLVDLMLYSLFINMLR